MKLSEIYDKKYSLEKNPIISFEVFPPKEPTQEKIDFLISELLQLKDFSPSLISVTHGAGGNGNSNNLELAKRIKNDTNIEIMPHFTCINSSNKNISEYIKKVEKIGFENVLALRGDLRSDIKAEFFDFRYANELVAFIKQNHNLGIAVAGYPEKHSEAVSFKADIENLKRKVDAGADVIYTQLFFNNSNFLRYREILDKNKINIPVIAGILPVISFSQIQKMVKMCQVEFPQNFKEKLEKYQDNKNIVLKLGIEFATKQCLELKKENVIGFHFYTLNKAYSTKEILKNIV